MKTKKPQIPKCPVCEKPVLARAMDNHIIGMAKGEVWAHFVGKIRTTPHAVFYKEHCKTVTTTVFTYKI